MHQADRYDLPAPQLHQQPLLIDQRNKNEGCRTTKEDAECPGLPDSWLFLDDSQDEGEKHSDRVDDQRKPNTIEDVGEDGPIGKVFVLCMEQRCRYMGG